MSSNLDHVFKILLIGNSNVGKTSILLQYSDGYFNENISATIGVDSKVKVVQSNGPDGSIKRCKVILWDTNGTERFRTLTTSYFRGSHGIILVYDVTSQKSFDNIVIWLDEIEKHCTNGGKDAVKLLVGNKVDQPREVPREVAEEWARARGMLFLEASAKTKEGISQVFSEVVQQILQNPVLLTNTRPAKKKDVVILTSKSNKRGFCC